MFSTSRYEIHVCFSTVVRCGLLGVCERTRLFSSYLLVCLFVCVHACLCLRMFACLLPYWPRQGRSLLLAAPSCSWLLMPAPGQFWLVLAAPGCSWVLLAALGCSDSLLACRSAKPVRNQYETSVKPSTKPSAKPPAICISHTNLPFGRLA